MSTLIDKYSSKTMIKSSYVLFQWTNIITVDAGTTVVATWKYVALKYHSKMQVSLLRTAT